MKEKINNLKEKTKQVVHACKGICVDFYGKSVPFFKNLTVFQAHKKQVIIAGIAVVLIASGAFAFYLSKDALISYFKEESPLFKAIRKAELAATGDVGSRLKVGNLEITLMDTIEDTYRPLEVDENFQRVSARGYFGAHVLIFNTGYDQQETLLFGLTDDLGNQYERDKEVDFYLNGIRDFGPAREIYPRTIRGGDIGDEKVYLLFSEIHPDAKNLQLIVMSETQNKKAVFDIER